MAARTPQRGHGGETGDIKRKERKHGKSELSPRLASAIKGGARVAGEELLMSMIPVARIPKLLKLIKGLVTTGKKAPTKGALKSMLEERGFKKLASVDPSLNELEVFLKKRSTRSDEIIKISPKRKVPRGAESQAQSSIRSAGKISNQKLQQEHVDILKRIKTAKKNKNLDEVMELEQVEEDLVRNMRYGVPREYKRLKELTSATRKAAESKAKKGVSPAPRTPPAPRITPQQQARTAAAAADKSEAFKRIRKFRNKTFRTSPRAGDVQYTLLDNDVVSVYDQASRTTTILKPRFSEHGRSLSFETPGFSKVIQQEINDKFGVMLNKPGK